MGEALRAAVVRQRMLLRGLLDAPMARLARDCAAVWPQREALEQLLVQWLDHLPSCKYLYALDAQGHQVTANVSARGLLPEHCGRDRSQRPYLAAALAGERFSLSDAYISRNARRPSLTALQRIAATDGTLLGFVGADFDLRELPLTREVYEQPGQWLQMKGDPAIRGGLFNQRRIDSPMDQHIDAVLDLVIELVVAHGVFHGKLHFSSSRATLWFIEDPFRYRILDIEDLTDPGIVLTYPTCTYPDEAVIPQERVAEVFHTLRALRFMDETIYLRAGSLNIFNGMVGLNFSCDGSHYMPWQELLEKKLDFWLGTGDAELDDAG
ncbi:MAG: hypothetical protein CMN57_06360 [Gammaproteobacteria bacterium]|nr:hypothetical protein [Gammaproteobacteria bacterium]